MSNAPALLGALAAGALLLLGPRLTRALRVTRSLRSARRERDVDLGRAAAYHRALPAAERAGALDDRAWADLDLDAVFVAIDRTRSEPGRQQLYHLLRTPRDGESLARAERVVRRLAADDADDAAAERVRRALDALADPRAGFLCDLVLGEPPRRPAAWWAFPLLTLGSVACLTLAAVWPQALVVWVGLCVANVGVQLVYRPRVKPFVAALHEVPALLRAARVVAEAPVDELADERRRLADAARRLGVLRHATWWLMFEPGQTNELAAMVYEYVNLLFLLDVNAFVLAGETIRRARAELRLVLDTLGAIDAAQSVAAWRAELTTWAVPDQSGQPKTLRVEDLTHPLVADAVPNDLDVAGRSVLITGSNMSGKSTFVRALGVNAVLARTLHTVCARSWRAAPLVVRTSIGRADSVVEGKSYYLAEVESVGALVRAAGGDVPHLFLLDEIFRGTNTTERVAAGAAVLAHLDRGDDLVVVATHDLELLELLGDRYAAYHFREQLGDDGLTFDYRIHDGPSSTRNAIALLSLAGYPESVVADALAAVERVPR